MVRHPPLESLSVVFQTALLFSGHFSRSLVNYNLTFHVLANMYNVNTGFSFFYRRATSYFRWFAVKQQLHGFSEGFKLSLQRRSQCQRFYRLLYYWQLGTAKKCPILEELKGRREPLSVYWHPGAKPNGQGDEHWCLAGRWYHQVKPTIPESSKLCRGVPMRLISGTNTDTINVQIQVMEIGIPT